MPINSAWHAKHLMPARATLAQRVKWHVAHAKHCGCRPMPRTVQAALARQSAQRKRPDRAG